MSKYDPGYRDVDHQELGGEAAGLAPGKRMLTAAIQRKASPSAAAAADAAAAPPAQAGPLIVADGAAVEPGQLAKTEYLARLRAAVTDTASEVLGPTWSASSCPDLQRIFAHYGGLDAPTVERIMQRYARVSSAVSAVEYIAAACARLVGAISRWGGGEELSWELGGSGLPAAIDGGGGGGAAASSGSNAASSGSSAAAVQLKASGAGEHAAVDPATDLGAGEAMDGGTSARMGGAFGDSFADVRVHTGASAAHTTRALGADAMAMGNQIAFASGEYRPGTPDGDALIAHELAHVIQQRGSAPVTQRRAVGVVASSAHEDDADQAATAVVARLHPTGGEASDGGAPIRPALTTGVGVQRGDRPKTPPKLAPTRRLSLSSSSEDHVVPQPLQQPLRFRVARLPGGVDAPKPTEKQLQDWNFGRDEDGEKHYNRAVPIAKKIDALRDYVNDQGIGVQHPNLGVVQGDVGVIINGLPQRAFENSFQRDGDEKRPQFLEDAGMAGYPLTDVHVRDQLLEIFTAQHSLFYQPMRVLG